MMIASKLIELLRKQISVILYGPSVNPSSTPTDIKFKQKQN